jgi:hypothetical protein
LKDKYDIIKGFFGLKKDINNYIIKLPDLGIFPFIKFLNFKKYSDRYFNFHQIISSEYGLLAQKSYNTAISVLTEYLESINYVDKENLIKALKVFEGGKSNYKLIIKGYTGSDYYREFNQWLYEYDSYAYVKTAFFLSGLIYSLNKYGKKQKTWEKKEINLYRGMTLSYIDLLPYDKNLGNIISFPNFISSSSKLSVAENFSQRKISAQERQKSEYFSVILTIKNNYQTDWVPNAINITKLSQYQKEKERIIQPFTFYKVTKVDINIKDYIADIQLETIGKKAILEKHLKKLKKGGKLRYNLKEIIMEIINK